MPEAPRVPVLHGLPAVCPEMRCGTLLQIDLREGMSVAPHYRYLHPGINPPRVQEHQ